MHLRDGVRDMLGALIGSKIFGQVHAGQISWIVYLGASTCIYPVCALVYSTQKRPAGRPGDVIALFFVIISKLLQW